MKTSKKLFCLLLVLLLTVCIAPAAFAEMVFSGEQENLSGEIDSTVFLAGENPVNNADVKGILFEAGNSVSSDGASEYAFMAGNKVALAGSNSRDAFVAGNLVSFSGSCGRDLAIAGNSVEISGTVARDLMAGGKSVVISGSVGGDVTIAAEEVKITDDAEIGGKLRYNSSAKISAPAGVLSGAEVYEDKGSENGAKDEKEDGKEDASPAVDIKPAVNTKPSSLLSKVKARVFSFIGLLLIAYFFLWLTPMWEKVDADYTGKSFGTYAKAFGIGFAVLAALPLASIILMVSGLGMRPAFVLIFVCAAAMIAAPVFLGFFLGALVWRKALKKEKNYWAELAVGLLLWAVLISIPGVSFLTRLIACALGLGVLARMLGKKKSAKLPEKQAVPETEPETGLVRQEEPESPVSLLPKDEAPAALEAPDEKED